MLPADLLAAIGFQRILGDALAFPLASHVIVISAFYQDLHDLIVRDAVFHVIFGHVIELGVNVMAVRN